MARYIQQDGQLINVGGGPRLPDYAHAIIHHGDNPDIERPVDLGIVTWVGTVEPNNWTNGDIWEAIGNVSNLEANYMLKDGSRAFIAPVGGVDPVDPAHLSTKAYVDNVKASGVSFTSSGLAVISGTSDVQAALEAADAAIEDRPTTQQIEDYVGPRLFHVHRRTTDSDDTGSTEIITDTINVTLPAGRKVKIDVFARVRATESSGLRSFAVRLREGSTVGVGLRQEQIIHQLDSAAGTTNQAAARFMHIIDNTGAGGSATYSLALQRTTGSWNAQIRGSSTLPTIVTFEDMGPA